LKAIQAIAWQMSNNKNMLNKPAPPYNTLISSGPQQCGRKHFPLLSCLSQREITLLTHRWELLQRQSQTYNA
jgi:hypothetical protein